MAEAAAFFGMTPREIHLLLLARLAQEEQRQQRLLLLARYTALAVHAPERLPAAPPASLAPMTSDQMKARFLNAVRKGSP